MKLNFANLHSHTDVEPYEIIRFIGTSTIEIRKMVAVKNNDTPLEWVVGGFAGHCVNQKNQKWDVTPDLEATPIRARLRKDGKYHSAYGRHVLSNTARKFYDYNF